MSLSDLEQEIIAEGKRVYAAAKKAALELRKSALWAEIQQIEAELATLLGTEPSEPASEPAPQPEPVPAEVAEPESAAAPEEAPEAPEVEAAPFKSERAAPKAAAKPKR